MCRFAVMWRTSTSFDGCHAFVVTAFMRSKTRERPDESGYYEPRSGAKVQRTTRRQMLAIAAGAVTGAVGGAAFRTSFSATHGSLLLRPPGTRNEAHFLAACIRCGQCIQACPFDTLRMAGANHGLRHGTPYLVPVEVPCYLCPEYDQPPCIDVMQGYVLPGRPTIDHIACTRCGACLEACPGGVLSLGFRSRPPHREVVSIGTYRP
jgi:formate hydrogenlyase subunit 6/NADH:ubiquinone oxidoreductase subunit I